MPFSWVWLVFCRLFCQLNNRVLGWGRRPLAAATAAAAATAKLPCAGRWAPETGVVFFAPREIHATYCLWHDHLWGYIMSLWYNVCIYNWQFRGTTPRQRLKPNSIAVGNMTWFAGYQVWSQLPKLVAITFDGLEQPWFFSKKWVVYNRPTSYNQQ